MDTLGKYRKVIFIDTDCSKRQSLVHFITDGRVRAMGDPILRSQKNY